MKKAAEDIENRMPVWRAFSELFLDTELSDKDYIHIAKVCSNSPYSLKDLEKILFKEVWSALRLNLYSMAGNWSGWSDDFIRDEILNKSRLKPYIWWRINPVKRFFLFDSWAEIARKLKR